MDLRRPAEPSSITIRTAMERYSWVGDPEEIAERIVVLHKRLGHMRQFFQMDVGHLPQKEFLHAIELLGTKVKPLVDAELREADSYQEAVDVR